MSVLDVDALVSDLDGLAASTWHKIRVGPQRGLKFREESITDHNLFELDQRHPGLTVYKFTSPEEAMNGADFDWWIGSIKDGWIGIRFQAKKLNDGAYSEIGHVVDGERQYDRLLREAHSDGLWPLYCFYNGWDDGWPDGVRNLICPSDLTPTSRASRKNGDCGHTRIQHFGCAVAPATYVQQRHRGPMRGRLELNDYLGSSIPWSFLFRVTGPKGSPASEREQLMEDLESALRSLFVRSDQLAETYERHDRLPYWVEAVRTGERSDERYAPKPRVTLVLDLAARE